MSSRITVRIDDIAQETDDIVTLTLSHPTGGELPGYDCGAHIDLYLPNGLVRQYSLWPAPGDRSSFRIAVKREPQSRGGSLAVHEKLKAGDEVEISHPRNNFPLVQGARNIVLLAGGIGITPLLSMALQMSRTDTPFHLHYFTRSPEQTAFLDLMSESGLKAFTTHYFGLGGEEVTHALGRILACREEGAHVYLCGPAPFMEAARSVAERTFPPEAIHLEFFSADTPFLAADGDSFEVRLAKSGVTLTIPSDKTIAQVMIENGIEVELSCEQGICGTCLTKVLEGEPQHEDMYLSEAEHAQNDWMAICVSRCRGRGLTLDI